MPQTLQQASTGADVIVAAEGISLHLHGRSLKLPGVRAGRTANLAVGAVVLTPRRLLASKGRWVLVDSDLFGSEQPHKVTFGADGVRLLPDVPTLFPDGAGEMELHWTIELSPTQLASLPSEPLSVLLPEQVAPVLRSAVG